MLQSGRARIGLAAIGLATLAVLPYLQTLGHDFVRWDDQSYITENPYVREGLNWRSLHWAFTTFWGGNWHPLTWLSHLIDISLWGMNPGGHHLTSLILHGANTLLVFLIFLRMTGGFWQSALVGALFAVHPMHVESVAWIAERKDVFSTFLGLLALWAYSAYTRRPSPKQYLTMMGLFTLSLMAKPMLVTFPFLLLLLDVWPLRRFQGQTSPVRRQIFFEKIPLFAIAVIFSGIAIVSQHAAGAIGDSGAFPLSSRVANALVGYCLYLGKLLLPVNLAFFYPLPDPWPSATVLTGAVLLLIVTALTTRCRGQRPWLLIGWLWFLGTLIPVIGLVQIGWQSIADRYTYLPAVGIFVMLAWSIPTTRPRLWFTAACVVVAVLTGMTSIQASYWKNSQTLFAHGAQVTRGNFYAHKFLGESLEAEHDLTGALELYRTAANECPPYAKIKIHENIANILIRQGRSTEAMIELKRAIEENPNSSQAYGLMGSIELLTNQGQAAANDLRRAIALDPRNKAAQINYGVTLVNLGRWNDAVAQLAPIARAEPERVVVRTNLALALAGRGDVDEAIHELQGVVQIAPEYQPARQALEQIENGKK
jgi:thioredoxin-like negative regulator of GroEL